MKTTRTQTFDKLRRGNLGELLRSRSVRLLLAGVAVVQGVAVVERAAEKEVRPAAVAEAPIQALAPVVAAAPSEAALAEARETAEKKKSLALAEKYNRDGYRVSPGLAEAIHEAALEHDIDPEIAFGLVRAESSFKNSSTSPVGAVGLTQLMPATARWMEPGVTRSQLRDPETNLRVGFKYLKYLLEKYDGNENLALLAYNRGPGTVDRAIKRGRNPDNGYADFVRGKKNHGHKLFTR